MSDTHDLLPSSETSFRQPTEEVDVILHCGDLTEIGTPASIEAGIKMLGSLKAELKLLIAGNHEVSLDRFLVETGSQTRKIMSKPWTLSMAN